MFLQVRARPERPVPAPDRGDGVSCHGAAQRNGLHERSYPRVASRFDFIQIREAKEVRNSVLSNDNI